MRCSERGRALGAGIAAISSGRLGQAAEALSFVVRSGVEDAAARAAQIRLKLQAKLRGR